MHEMSIISSLFEMVKQELAKNNATKIVMVRVKYGRLANLVPEAMSFAWEALTVGTEYADAKLELEEVPLVVRCFKCGKEFQPENEQIILMPCPECGEEFGHTIISGKELYLDRMIVE